MEVGSVESYSLGWEVGKPTGGGKGGSWGNPPVVAIGRWANLPGSERIHLELGVGRWGNPPGGRRWEVEGLEPTWRWEVGNHLEVRNVGTT